MNNYYAESFPAVILSGTYVGSGLSTPLSGFSSGLGIYYYSWKEVVLEPQQGAWSGQPNPRFGVANAREIDNNLRDDMPFFARLHYEGVLSGQPFFSFTTPPRHKAVELVRPFDYPTSGTYFYSGGVYTATVAVSGGAPTYNFQRSCWINQNNYSLSNASGLLVLDNYYVGVQQMASGQVSGLTAPVYFCDASPHGLTGLISGAILTSGYCQSGTLTLHTESLSLLFIDGLLQTGSLL